MKFSFVALLAILQAVAASTPGVVRVNFDVHRGSLAETATKGAEPYYVKRETAGVILLDLVNEHQFYLASLTIGSNKQKVGVLVDTGSSDLWVTGYNNPYCRAGTSNITWTPSPSVPGASAFRKRDTQIDCSVYGTFDKDTSTSFRANATGFYIRYADTTFASGSWGHDTVTMDSFSVSDLSFAVADLSNSTMAVLGIGLPGIETTNYQYENLPMKMKSSGLIGKNLYSVFLNEWNATQGSVLFGGVDHSRYTGDLLTLPIVGDGLTVPLRLIINMDLVSVDGTTVSTGSMDMLLDTGSTLCLFPAALVALMALAAGFVKDSASGLFTIDCETAKAKDFTFEFTDGSKRTKINAPIFNFVTLVQLENTNTCYLRVGTSSGTGIFGDSFLRAAYVVFDLDAYQISLANADYSNPIENVVAVISTIPPKSTQASSTVASSSSSHTTPHSLPFTNSAAPTSSTSTTAPTISPQSDNFSSKVPSPSSEQQSLEESVSGFQLDQILSAVPTFASATTKLTSEGTAVLLASNTEFDLSISALPTGPPSLSNFQAIDEEAPSFLLYSDLSYIFLQPLALSQASSTLSSASSELVIPTLNSPLESYLPEELLAKSTTSTTTSSTPIATTNVPSVSHPPLSPVNEHAPPNAAPASLHELAASATPTVLDPGADVATESLTVEELPVSSPAPASSSAPGVSGAPAPLPAPTSSSALGVSGAPAPHPAPAPSSAPGVSGAPAPLPVPAPSSVPGVSGAPAPHPAPAPSSASGASGTPVPLPAPTSSSVPGVSGAPALSSVSAPSITSPSAVEQPVTSSAPVALTPGAGMSVSHSSEDAQPVKPKVRLVVVTEYVMIYASSTVTADYCLWCTTLSDTTPSPSLPSTLPVKKALDPLSPHKAESHPTDGRTTTAPSIEIKPLVNGGGIIGVPSFVVSVLFAALIL